MPYSGVQGRWFWVAITSLGMTTACGGQSKEDDHVLGVGGGLASTASGGTAASSGASSHAHSGGTQSQSTTATSSAGTTSTLVHTGGTLNTGGAKSTSSQAGGSKATGGSPNTGGSKPAGGTSSGGIFSQGGKSTVGGASTGGQPSTGGLGNTGGRTAVGGSGNTGGTLAGGTSASQGGSSAGSTALAEFCKGPDAKLNHLGQTVEAPATSYAPEMLMSCCFSYGVNLHAKPTLDFDVAVEIIVPVSGNRPTPGVYDVSTELRPFHIVARKSTEWTSIGAPTSGTAELFTSIAQLEPWQLGFCIEVTDSASALYGTRIYVPKVAIAGYEEYSRWQMFLLSDETITPAQAAAQSLDSLVLAERPLLDLQDIAYVDRSSGEIGFNPGVSYGKIVKSRLDVSVQGLPFVIIADKLRVYLGSFTTGVSSIGPTGPWVMFEDITADNLTIQPAVKTARDQRFDEPIATVLAETGKLIP